jgi:hypothetical protein
MSVPNKETKKLVIARIQTMPPTMKLSIHGGSFSRDDLIAHVEKNDEIGKKIVKIHLNYLRSIANQ